MSRKINFALGEFYHLYNRGVEKRDIFLDQADRDRFTKLLFLCNSHKPIHFQSMHKVDRGRQSLLDTERGETIVSIGAYCLMPNHFHLLLRETNERGISKFILKLLTAYSMYFNKRYARVGPLFQRPSLAKHLAADDYLRYIFSYIHLNPVKLIDGRWKEDGVKDLIRTKNYLANYHYSSYQDYLGKKRKEIVILDKESFPDYFQEPKDFQDFLDCWLDNKIEAEP